MGKTNISTDLQKHGGYVLESQAARLVNQDFVGIVNIISSTKLFFFFTLVGELDIKIKQFSHCVYR